MSKSFTDSILEEEILKIGLKVLTNGRGQDGFSYYIQCCDLEEIFDDGTFSCHYEILNMGTNDSEHGNHIKDKVYVEIHFENKNYSKFFKPVLEQITTTDKTLELFNWRDYCPGIRIKDSVFSVNDKQDILDNLCLLKKKTIDILLSTYRDIKNVSDWISGFSLIKSNKKTAKKRLLSEFQREQREIIIIHEQIKDSLISKIKSNPKIIGTEIDISTLSEENEVNKINYIDLAAKTINGEIIFFEIKTSSSARLCIRQALGQLMEYAFFPDVQHAKYLIVVGTGPKNKDIESYIALLQQSFHININYLQISL